MQKLKNSLKNFLVEKKYTQPKIVIGSFLIVAVLGFSSLVALSTTDHLVAWTPEQAEFYMHVKDLDAGLAWKKIKNFSPYQDLELELIDIIPRQAEEIALFSLPGEEINILFYSDQPALEREGLYLKKLEEKTFVITKKEDLNLSKSKVSLIEKHGFAKEPATAQGFLYIANTQASYISPSFINNWSGHASSEPNAWALTENQEALIWQNQSDDSHASANLNWDKIPQNTNFWMHGQNFMAAWQNAFQDFVPKNSVLALAAEKLLSDFDRINKPDQSFQSLFVKPYNIFILGTSENQSFVLALEYDSGGNPIALNNFEQFLLKTVQKQYPSSQNVAMPDQTRYSELILDENLAWQDLNIGENSIRWIKGEDDEMIIGYFLEQNQLILSNNFANLVDFIYSQDKESWLDLAKISNKCRIPINEIYAYLAKNPESTPLSKILNRFTPWLISMNSDFCYVDKYVDKP